MTLSIGRQDPSTASRTPVRLMPEPSVEAHREALWRYLRHLGADRDVAADLCQSALAVWWERRADVEAGRDGAFLRTTARNLWRNWLRARGRSPEVSWGDAVDAVWNGPASPDERLLRLRACLDQLDGRGRQAIALAYTDQLGRRDIGERLGMSADGVKSLLRRTRLALARCIERREEEPS